MNSSKNSKQQASAITDILLIAPLIATTIVSIFVFTVPSFGSGFESVCVIGTLMACLIALLVNSAQRS